jgi:hypothetical protein
MRYIIQQYVYILRIFNYVQEFKVHPNFEKPTVKYVLLVS